MSLLNRYFTPFAALMILAAVFSGEADARTVRIAGGVWALSLAVNWWFSANTYRFIHWAPQLKALQVWLNFLWAVPLFHLLQPFWGPTWLLFVMAPVTAALYQGWWQTLAAAVVSAGTMTSMYWWRGGGLMGAPYIGMVLTHAAFIVIFSLFIHSLAQTALRLRDLSSR